MLDLPTGATIVCAFGVCLLALGLLLRLGPGPSARMRSPAPGGEPSVIDRLAPVALAAVLILAGCQAAPAPTKPAVVATVYPLWELARPVAGDRAEVVSLVPPGVEPHDWEPSARDVTLVQRATVFIHTGTGLDAWAARLLRACRAASG